MDSRTQSFIEALLAGRNRDEAVADMPLVESGTFFLSRGRMIRTDRWKYAHYADDLPELYDLQSDPWEQRNLSGRADTAAVECSMRASLLERTIEAGDPR